MTDHSNIEEYNYDLPSDKIALTPLANRSNAKLLVYNKGMIEHDIFAMLPSLTKDQLLVFNDSRVIQARILAENKNGNRIEIFLLNPVQPLLYKESLETNTRVIWKCQIGNKKKWRIGENLIIHAFNNAHKIELNISYADFTENHILFEWAGKESFAEIVQVFGLIPLPPYIKRETTELDKQQYQTVYSKQEGSVAAPTAGLHFTPEILNELLKNGNRIEYITLHVSAGTFKPITEKDISHHKMHAETFSFSTDFLLKLADNSGNITAVGTTSLRVIESIYWLAVLHDNNDKDISQTQFVEQNCWMNEHTDKQVNELLLAYYNQLVQNKISEVIAETEIFITPGYTFRIVNKLITNFHMPKSTLICLVAAFVGADWKLIYKEALKENYRFLSYGDSSLLIPRSNTDITSNFLSIS